jgi:uncharacterized protein YhfF
VNHANLKKHQEPNIANPHSGKASLSHANHEGEQDHALSWREINRVFFTAAAAGAIWLARRILTSQL